MTLVDQLGGTRSSHRWAEMPGNWDRLNTRALYASSNEWGIPDLPAADWQPDKLVAYNDRWALQTAPANSAVHFFLDDYRFETVWTKPERGLSRLTKVGAALSPDFSLWRNMPKVMQIWQVYRARWCAAWMIQHGIRVIPTIGWSDEASFDFCFTGIPMGSVVAVSTVGLMRDKEAMALFHAGLFMMLHDIAPSRILVYGHKLDVFDKYDVEFVQYPTRWRGAPDGGGRGGNGRSSAAKGPSVNDSSVDSRIVSTIENLVAQKTNPDNPYVWIADVREAMPDVSGADFDKALLKIGLGPNAKLSIEPEVNQKVLTPRLRSGGIVLGGDENNELVRIRA